jgi:transposase
VIKARCSYDHLSVISAITPKGSLCLSVQEQPFTAETVVKFLRKLHRQIKGKVLVIWDGAAIHRAQEIKNYLAKGAAKWLQLEKLPAYAPDLNPDEGIWNYLKRVELANTCSQNLSELYLRIQDATRRLRRKHRVILGCISQAGLTI